MTKIEDIPEDRIEAAFKAVHGSFGQMEAAAGLTLAGTVASIYATAAAAWLTERFGPRAAYDLFQEIADSVIECQLPEGA